MTKEIFNIENKVIVLTGGLGQLGKAFISEIIKRNARVAVIDIFDSTHKKVLDVSKKFNDKNFLYIYTDITQKKEIHTAKKQIIKTFGKVDVLINNAALDSPPNAPDSEVGRFEEYPEESFDKVMDVNVKGAYLCCQVFGEIMSRQKKGNIINVSSIYGLVSPRQDIYEFRRKQNKTFYKPVAYSISKSAIYNLTRYLATYWAKDNIRVNTITFAGVYNKQPDEFLNEYYKHIPFGRMMNINEAVGPIIFLASDASSYMTGSNLIVDGGWTAW